MNGGEPATSSATELAGLAEVLDQVSTSRMKATVDELAADRYAGRRVGTAGGGAAGAWLADRLRELGAAVRVDRFPVPGVRDLHRAPVLEWSAGGASRRLAHRRDFVVHLASSDLPKPRTGPLVDPHGRQLRGSWVLAPADAWSTVVARAEAEGAAGVLGQRGTDAEGWMPKMIQGPAGGTVPLIGIRADLYRRLAGALSEGEVSVTASTPLRTVEVDGANVHGQLLAGGNGRRVLLTAHYDGVGDDPDRRLPAAADNAAGVAAVLEAARIITLAAPPVDLAVSFVDAEETGASGSARHAATVPPGTLVINVDGAGQLRGAAAVEAGGPAHHLLSTLDQAGRRAGVALQGGTVASDNRRYAGAGLPAVGLGLGVPGYHTPADTPDRVEPETLRAAARLVVATVWLLAHAVPPAGGPS